MSVQNELTAVQSLRVDALDKSLQFFCEHKEEFTPTARNVLIVADAFATFLDNSSVPLTDPLEGV